MITVKSKAVLLLHYIYPEKTNQYANISEMSLILDGVLEF